MHGDGVARFEMECPAEWDKAQGVAHGGWVTSILTEMAGHTLILSGGVGFLGTLNGSRNPFRWDSPGAVWGESIPVKAGRCS
jgi:hypothetical protein